MPGIPSHLMNSLRAALMDCEPFETNSSLRSLFADARLSPWRNSLPQADGISKRVESVIYYLHDKNHSNGSNALVSLLLVLAETIDPGDDRHAELKTLADQLRQPSPAAPKPVDAGRSGPSEGGLKPAAAMGNTTAGKPEATASPEKRDFFISYNQHDKDWAEWIAWQLENAGYTTFIQAWDFRPAGNFVADMQKAAAKSERTIAVLSETYLASRFTQSEWNAAFRRDPTGEEGLLLPVKVRPCYPEGLLAQIVYIDLTGLASEQATERLLAGIKRGRAKPLVPPNFPGTVERAEPPLPDSP